MCRCSRVAGRVTSVVIAPAVVAIAMSACIGTSWPRGTWVKPGVDPGEQRHDEYACERDAVTMAQGSARKDVWERCMHARGYVRVR